MASANIPSKLNPVQLYLLELFSQNFSEDDLVEIKKLLVQFYQQKIDQETDTFWDRKKFTEEGWDQATRDQHFRSENASE